MFNRIVKYFLENRLITFLFLISFIIAGLVTMPFVINNQMLPRDPVPVDAIPDIGEKSADRSYGMDGSFTERYSGSGYISAHVVASWYSGSANYQEHFKCLACLLSI